MPMVQKGDLHIKSDFNKTYLLSGRYFDKSKLTSQVVFESFFVLLFPIQAQQTLFNFYFSSGNWY